MARFRNILPAALLAAVALQVGSFIAVHSNVYDEAAYIGAGVSYLKTGGLRMDMSEHPPLMKYLIGLSSLAAAPLWRPDSQALKDNDSYRLGLELLYGDPKGPERLLSFARLPSLFLSLGLALMVFSWARRWYGELGGIFALAAYAFEPNLLAHSGLATMDLALACFLFGAFHFLVLWDETRRSGYLACCGIFAGAAVSVKLPGIIFFGWLLLFLSFPWRRHPRKILLAAAVMGISLLVLLAAYAFDLRAFRDMSILRFFQVFLPHTRNAFYGFLHGHARIGGFWDYYPTAFAIKMTLPFLILTAWAALSDGDRRKKALLLMPSLSFFAFCCAARYQNGFRYASPILPFLCVFIGSLADKTSLRRRIAAAALIALGAVESLRVCPHYLEYFNQLAGGPSNGYHWLVATDLDWGQDYPALSRFIKKNGSPETIAALVGNADRDLYLGPHQDLIEDPLQPDLYFRHINSPNPKKEWLLLSATFLQGYGLGNPDAFAWLRTRKPVAQIAYQTFIYDVTDDPQSHARFADFYAQRGLAAFAAREKLRSRMRP
jgi:hypothetical protein